MFGVVNDGQVQTAGSSEGGIGSLDETDRLSVIISR
jgi:hypothetical protein